MAAVAAFADRARPDVVMAYPLYGDGARLRRIVRCRTRGTCDVCVYAINVASGNTNPLLACRSVVVT